MYPHHLVNDEAKGIMGSCSSYSTRKDITSIMKYATLSQAEAYGNKLVIVASQTYRYDAIFSSLVDPEIVLSDLQYCILECIARNRTGRFNNTKAILTTELVK